VYTNEISSELSPGSHASQTGPGEHLHPTEDYTNPGTSPDDPSEGVVAGEESGQSPLDPECDELNNSASGSSSVLSATADANENDSYHDQRPDPGCQELNELQSSLDTASGSAQMLARDADVSEDTAGMDLEALSDLAQLDELKLSLKFIRALENASLDDENTGLDPECLERL